MIKKEVRLMINNLDHGLFRINWNDKDFINLNKLHKEKQNIKNSEILSDLFFQSVNGFLASAEKINKYEFKSSLIILEF